jgi:hypothetical protein
MSSITARPRTAHHCYPFCTRRYSFAIPALPLYVLFQFHLSRFLGTLQFSNIRILFWFPVATRRKHIVLFSIRIVFRFPAWFIDILVLFQHHCTLQHSHSRSRSRSLSIPFDNTTHEIPFRILVQRHKIPSHYFSVTTFFRHY